MTDTPIPKTNSITTWLWNPFTLIAGSSALIAGLILILASGSLASLTNTHFDGVLDTHTGSSAPLWFFLSEGIVNWLCLAVVLWICGLLLSGPGKFRALDLFGTQALARWPFLLTALVCFLPGFRTATAVFTKIALSGKLTMPQVPVSAWIQFFLAVFVMLFVTIWFVALAWKSFRISCDVRGGKAVAAFVIAIIVAEAISIIVIRGGFSLLK